MKEYWQGWTTTGRPLSNKEVLERIEWALARERRRFAAAIGLIGLWAALITIIALFLNDLGPAKPPAPTFERPLQSHATWEEYSP